MPPDVQPTLFVVDTPIGNLDDLSLRAKQVLRRVSVVIAEDTRRTNKLLLHLETEAELMSFHEHSNRKKCEKAIRKIRDEGEAALVSDAGSPVVSDPGAELIRATLERAEEIDVVPVPGPSAVTAALAVSGFPTDRFRFAGYPPESDTDREEWLRSIQLESDTVIVFVPPHDLPHLVRDLANELPERRVAAANELTKEHETVVHSTCSELAGEIDELNTKGEWTLVLEPLEKEESTGEESTYIPDEELNIILETGVKLSSGARILAKMRDIPRGKAYNLLQRRKDERGE